MAFPTPAALRSAECVMQLQRLGSFHQSRLSFVRSIIRRMVREQWTVSTTHWELNAQGLGTVVQQLKTPHGLYSFVLFSEALTQDERSDRVIAEKWDVTFCLCEGALSPEDIVELQQNVPKQEAGRVNARVLVLSRANKSVRNFEAVVDALACGKQPNPELLKRVGYLYRTTAVYGNGKFGLADYARLQQTPDFSAPFSAQMLTVYLLREVSADIAEHLAKARNPQQATTLSLELRRYLGVGNATGLGMAPFLVRHPRLIDAWVTTREQALARVLYQSSVTAEHVDKLKKLLQRAAQHTTEIETIDARQHEINQQLIADMHNLHTLLDTFSISPQLWQQLSEYSAAHHQLETQELLHCCLLEIYPELVNDLEDTMSAPSHFSLDPNMRAADLITLLETRYAWALAFDFTEPDNSALFWYRSEVKGEPRLGVRALEKGADKEVALDIARQVRKLYDCLMGADALEEPVGLFLLRYPEQRGIVQRVQTLSLHHYGDIQANILHTDTLPIHLLRCKLSFFGASKFDPKSSRWVRITLFQGAPTLAEMAHAPAEQHAALDDWFLPIAPVISSGRACDHAYVC